MPGDIWQKFANLRLLLSYMICQPGKKLLFMGGEIGQWNEWNCKFEIEWQLLNFPLHRGIQKMVADLNHFYLKHPPFWELDFSHETFRWIDFADSGNSVVSYQRIGKGERLLCVHNFTPMYHPHYVVHFSDFSKVEEVFNTDAEKYGGSGKFNHGPEVLHQSDGRPAGLAICMAPLATMIFKIYE